MTNKTDKKNLELQGQFSGVKGATSVVEALSRRVVDLMQNGGVVEATGQSGTKTQLVFPSLNDAPKIDQ